MSRLVWDLDYLLLHWEFYFIYLFISFIFFFSLSLWSLVMSHIEYLMYLLVGGIGLVNVCPRCGILLPCFMIWQERNSYTFEDV